MQLLKIHRHLYRQTKGEAKGATGTRVSKERSRQTNIQIGKHPSMQAIKNEGRKEDIQANRQRQRA